MKFRKVWLSLLLAVTLVVTLLPAVALAGENAGTESQYALSFDWAGDVDLYSEGDSSRLVSAELWDEGEPFDGNWDIAWDSSNKDVVDAIDLYNYLPFGEERSVTKILDDNPIPVPLSLKAVVLVPKSAGQATVTATASIGGDEVASNSLTVNVSDPERISVGQTKTLTLKVGEGTMLVFKPTKTAHYIFYSQGSVDPKYNPEVYIRALDNKDILYDDSSYAKSDIDYKAGNTNFEHCFLAIAGHTYCLHVSVYDHVIKSRKVAEDSFAVGLKYGPKEQAEEAIASANAKPAAKYKYGSYSKMVDAKKYLEKLMKDPEAAAEEILAAADALRAAISNLQRKAANTLAVKSVNKSYKARKMKKKKVFKAVTIKNRGQGALTYAVKPMNKKSKKALSFNKKTGKITVKKGTKKGTYKMVITIKTAGSKDYLPGKVVKTITVKVKK